MKSSPSVVAPVALQTFYVAAVLSLVHRLMAFKDLANGTKFLSEAGLRALAVGSMSDLWVATLLAALMGVVAFILKLAGKSPAAWWLPATLGSVLAVLIAGHQAYVGFFHFAIIPYHVTYLTDWRFLRSNGSSMFAWRPFTLLIFGLALAWSTRLMPRPALKNHKAEILFTAIACLCLFAHSRNIHWRVQWFIPENLQLNPAERLYVRFFTDTLPAPLDDAEREWLSKALREGPKTLPQAEPADAALFDLLSRSSVNSADAPQLIATKIKAQFAASLLAKHKPVAMILLLESLRPAETGYFAPNSGQSLTPNLDALAAAGIPFKRAYSTGSVTRGAQEATMCGYLGSRSTSLMRGGAVARVACLPDLVTAVPNPLGARGETFWYHGGDARYDEQEPYWRRHSVHDLMDWASFPSDAPHTGWGVSDRQFLAAAAARLVKLRETTNADYLFGLGLSVTNHIPWTVPADAGPEVNAPRAQGHDSYRTTAYTDAAVGAFVAAMKAKGIWQDMLLVIASDHGNQVPPLVDLYPTVSAGNKDLPLQSHVNLIVTGGLTEQALSALPTPLPAETATVSQADIAPFLAYVIDLPSSQFMAENLFTKQRDLPVLSNLDEVLVDQNTGRAFTPAELSTEKSQPLPPAERKGLLYYRAFLQYIYTPPKK